jgi:hypothetical protein
MVKSSKVAWKIVPLRHFFPPKVVPLIEVLLYCDSWGAHPSSSTLPDSNYLGFHAFKGTPVDSHHIKNPQIGQVLKMMSFCGDGRPATAVAPSISLLRGILLWVGLFSYASSHFAYQLPTCQFILRYRRTSISGTKKAQIIFPLRHFFPLLHAVPIYDKASKRRVCLELEDVQYGLSTVQVGY